MMADASLQTGPKELDPASLGLAIRERRKAARMTQEVTASLCGISKKTLIKIEKGGCLPLDPVAGNEGAGAALATGAGNGLTGNKRQQPTRGR